VARGERDLLVVREPRRRSSSLPQGRSLDHRAGRRGVRPRHESCPTRHRARPPFEELDASPWPHPLVLSDVKAPGNVAAFQGAPANSSRRRVRPAELTPVATRDRRDVRTRTTCSARSTVQARAQLPRDDRNLQSSVPSSTAVHLTPERDIGKPDSRTLGVAATVPAAHHRTAPTSGRAPPAQAPKWPCGAAGVMTASTSPERL
jgi:hypothetical protein